MAYEGITLLMQDLSHIQNHFSQGFHCEFAYMQPFNIEVLQKKQLQETSRRIISLYAYVLFQGCYCSVKKERQNRMEKFHENMKWQYQIILTMGPKIERPLNSIYFWKSSEVAGLSYLRIIFQLKKVWEYVNFEIFQSQNSYLLAKRSMQQMKLIAADSAEALKISQAVSKINAFTRLLQTRFSSSLILSIKIEDNQIMVRWAWLENQQLRG